MADVFRSAVPVAPRRRRCQRGASLLEALIAFLVLGLGILAISRVQTHLRLGSDIARQRAEAVRLGQAELETLRAYSVVAASAGAHSYAEIASAAATIDPDSGYATHTRYLLLRQIRSSTSADAKEATVTVGWADRRGSDQAVVLNTIISAADPLHSAALSLPPSGTPVKGAHGRSMVIPLAARHLGNGTSVFKPVESGSVAYVFDNRSGLLVARCLGVDATIQTHRLTHADLVGCEPRSAYLLSGTIRFSLSAPPEAARAWDVPLDLTVLLTLTGGTYPAPPSCASEARKTVSWSSAGAVRTESVPLGATPASRGLAAWTETGEREVAYHCVVDPLATGRWSGHTALVPSGWTIGTGAADHRICRYAADADGSGAVDANIEHPASYAAVSGPLVHQNFLVIAGTQSCPAGSPVRIVGAPGDVYVNLATVQHQP